MRRLRRTLVLAGLIAAAAAAPAHAYVYWTDLNGPSEVGRADLDGSAPNDAFIPGGASDGAIAVDANHIYWANRNTNASGNPFQIGRANLDGSGADPGWITGIADSVGGIATDGVYLYWTDGHEIGRQSLSGGPPNLDFITDPTDDLGGIAVDSGMLYVTDQNTILRVPTTGGTPQVFVTAGPPGDVLVFSVAVANGYLYWPADHSVPSAHGTIARAPITDPTNVMDPFIDGLHEPTAVATDGSYVYWSDVGGTVDEIGRASIADVSKQDTTFITDPNQLEGVAVDAGIDPTATAVSCLAASVAVGATTTCTAKVSDSASTAPPTGTVNFTAGNTAVMVGSNPCTLGVIGGVAQCTIGVEPTLSGQLTIAGAYSGDTLHEPSAGSTPLCAGTALQCTPPPPPKPACVVPRLKGKTLGQARAALKKAHCKLGKVTKPKPKRGHKPGRLVVSSTKPKAGTTLADGAKVSVRLVPARR